MFFEKLHSYSKTLVFKILLGLVCSSFVVFGLADLVVRAVNDKPLAKVGSTVITGDEFAHSINQETNRIMELSKAKIDPAALRQMGFHQAILDRLVNARAMNEFFKLLQFKSSPHMIKQVIQSIPAFQRNGIYDEALLKHMLENRRISAVDFSREIKTLIYQDQLIETLNTSTDLPSIYKKIVGHEIVDQHTYKAVLIDLDKQKIEAPVSDAEVKIFFEKNQEKYRMPEFRTAQYVLFDEEQDSKSFAADEREIQERYEQMHAEFTTSEARFVERYSCANQAICEDVLEFLKKGVLFKEVAGKVKAAKFEDMGLIEKEMLSLESEEAIFNTPEGAHSGMVSNGSQYFVYHVVKIKPSSVKPLEEVKPQVVRSIQKEKYVENIQKIKDSFEDALAAGQSLSDVAKTLGHKVVNLEAFDRSGLSPKGENMLKGLSDEVRSSILEQAFEQIDGSECKIVDLGSGFSVAVRIGTIQKTMIPEFSTIKERISLDFAREQKQASLEKLLNSMKKEVKTAEGFASYAQKHHFGALSTHTISHVDEGSKEFWQTPSGQFFKDLPKSLFSKIFKTPVGRFIIERKDEKTIAVLFHHSSKDNSPSAKLQETLNFNLVSALHKDISQQVVEIAKHRIDVVINQEILERLTRALNNGD